MKPAYRLQGTFFQKKSEKKLQNIFPGRRNWLYLPIIKNKTDMLIQVETKARKNYPSRPTKYVVDLQKNESIAIMVDGQEVNRFNLGDEAEYNSYNLIYTGPITKITEKTVQVTAYPGTRSERRYNLSLNEFCWRNEKFNAAKAAKHNQEEMYYL